MICPSCGHDNFPGADRCEGCTFTLMQMDVPRPTGHKLQKTLLQGSVVKVLRRKKPTLVQATDTISKALKHLQKAGHGCVLVEENDSLVGILSERDVLYKVAGKVSDLDKVSVRDIMTPNPVTLGRDQSIGFALNKMAVGGFRHIPIMDGGKTLGVVSIRDVLVFLQKSL